VTVGQWIASVAALGAAILALLSAIGMWAMRDPYQRLQYLALPATASAALLALALWLGLSGNQAGAKGTLAALALAGVNGVLTHATARVFKHREESPEPTP
jgi:multisubunit Na+/H+ antiporter MnhG subunit